MPQILVQIQQTAIQSQRALTVSKQQTAAKERERRILQLTIEEIKSLDEDVKLYKGVGKMCASMVICKSLISWRSSQVHASPSPNYGKGAEG